MLKISRTSRFEAKLAFAAVLVLFAGFGVVVPASAQRDQPRSFDDIFRPDRDKNRADPRVDPKGGDKSGDPHALPDGKKGPPGKDALSKDAPGKNGKSADAKKEPKPIPRSMPRPGGSNVPEAGSQRAALLSELYAYLATATDEDVAQRTANAIQHVWQSNIGDTVALLMERGTRAEKEKKGTLALKLFGEAVALAPDNPEVFTRRALIYYSEGDLERAMGDLRRALALDPNHYRSLESLAQILKELDRKKDALLVYRRLYEVHPFFSGAKAAIEELSREVEGHGA